MSSATGTQDTSKPPVPAKPGMSVQGSSALEPSSQTFAKPSTSQDRSVSAHSSGSSSQDLSSFYPTGAEAFCQPSEVFSQPYPLSFTGPLEADDIPLSETHESDPDFSGSVSDSEDNTESLDKPEQTEELNYRETVRLVHSFVG